MPNDQDTIMTDYIYDADGIAVGFIRGQYIHGLSGEAIGQIRGTHVHRLSGPYVGEMHEGMVVKKHAGNFGNVGHPGNPGNPGAPGSPLRRTAAVHGLTDLFPELLK